MLVTVVRGWKVKALPEDAQARAAQALAQFSPEERVALLAQYTEAKTTTSLKGRSVAAAQQ